MHATETSSAIESETFDKKRDQDALRSDANVHMHLDLMLLFIIATFKYFKKTSKLADSHEEQ
jgi:hypothetical protein